LSQDDSIYLTGSNSYTIDVLQFNQNTALYIGTNASLTVSKIVINKDARFYIDGSFTSTGNMDMKKDSGLDIQLSGTLQIDGDFDGSTGIDLNVDGNMDIGGDFNLGTGSIITGSGSIDVTGTITNNGTDVDGLLPVVLHYFKVDVVDQGVLLHWETLAELNNDYFTIERSLNGSDFEAITTIPGQGTTNEINKYEYLDRNPVNGVSYYRLKQTDFDGTTETFRMVAVQFFGVVKSSLNLYPNPVTDNFIRIEANSLSPGKPAVVTITDLAGRSIFNRTYRVDNRGIFHEEIAELTSLPTGVYILSLNQVQKHQTLRFVKK
jgi:hypothetical protein